MSAEDPITLHGVLDPGVPNLERVALYVNEVTEAKAHGLMVGMRRENGDTLALSDYLYLLGDLDISSGDWIFVYTGPGVQTESALDNGHKLFKLYWMRQSTVFYRPGLIPILFQVHGFQTVPRPPDPVSLPQRPQTHAPSPTLAEVNKPLLDR